MNILYSYPVHGQLGLVIPQVRLYADLSTLIINGEVVWARAYAYQRIFDVLLQTKAKIKLNTSRI